MIALSALWDWAVNYLGFALELSLACVLYMLPLNKRPGFSLRLAAGILLMLAFAGLIPRSLLRYLLEFAAAAVLVWGCCDLSFWDALYCAVCGYATQHFAFCCHTWLNRTVGGLARWYYPAKLATFLAVYLAFFFLIARRLPEKGRYNAGARQSLFSLLLILTCTILLSNYVTSRIVAGTAAEDLYICFLYAMLCCFAALWLQVLLQRQSRLQREMDLKERLWHQQKAQYHITKENIALINRKCHDLKHQIAALARPEADGARSGYLKELEDSIQIYDCTVKTGSEVLDTVLTEKKLYCEAHQINMTCVADGSKLGFMDPVDVYAMLGNAIDNAIEAVSGLPDPEQRLIAVSVWTGRGLLLPQFENYFDHALTFEDGLPATTKARDGYHGFGIPSIRSTAEKYGGCMTLHAEDGLFVLRVSIPLP